MKEVRVIRHACTEPKVAELIQFTGNHGSTQYKEIFPEQVTDMLLWLAGTQRFPAAHPNKTLDGDSDTVRVLRQGLYQYIQEEFPGGLVEFLGHFPRD